MGKRHVHVVPKGMCGEDHGDHGQVDQDDAQRLEVGGDREQEGRKNGDTADDAHDAEQKRTSYRPVAFPLRRQNRSPTRPGLGKPSTASLVRLETDVNRLRHTGWRTTAFAGDHPVAKHGFPAVTACRVARSPPPTLGSTPHRWEWSEVLHSPIEFLTPVPVPPRSCDELRGPT